MTTATLGQNISRGARWVFYWRLANRLLGLLNTVCLIRILAPSDFGLIALATTISTAVEQLSYIGVEQSIVREKDPKPDIYDTGFTLNVLRSAATGVFVAVAAYPAASFFGEPRLAIILLCLGGATAFMGFQNIWVVDFQRHLDFRREFLYLMFARVVGVVIAIAAALILRNYWALVVGIVSGRMLRVLSSYIFHPGRARFSLASWRHLVGYSTWTWLWGIVTILRERADTVVIGWRMASLQVGIFSVAFDFASLVTSELLEPLQRAGFAGLAHARNTGVRPGEILSATIGMALLLAVPACVGLALVADPFTRLVIGVKWLDAVPLLQILCVLGMTTIPGIMCRVLLNSQGQLKTIVAVTFLFGCVRIVLLLALIHRAGLIGAAVASGSSLALESAAYIVVVRAYGGVGFRQLGSVSWRPLLAAAAMAGVMYLTGLGGQASGASGTFGWAAELLLQAAIGAVLYVAAITALWTLSGRPAGPERIALTSLMRTIGRRRIAA